MLKFKTDSEWNVFMNENINALKLEIDLRARIFSCSKKARLNFHAKWNSCALSINIRILYLYILPIYSWTNIKIIDWEKNLKTWYLRAGYKKNLKAWKFENSQIFKYLNFHAEWKRVLYFYWQWNASIDRIESFKYTNTDMKAARK